MGITRRLFARNGAKTFRGELRTGPQGSRPVRAVAILALLLGFLLPGEAVRAQAGAPDLSRPLSLEELVALATSRNLDLAQAREGVAAAQGSYVGSYSGLLPQISASIGYDHTYQTYQGSFQEVDPSGPFPVTRTVEGTFKNVARSYGPSVTGSVRQLGLPSIYDVRQAGHGVESARYGLQSARNGTVLAVKQQYYALIRAQQLSEVSRQAHTLAQDQLRRARSLFELGSVAKSDVLQAQVNLSTSERDSIAAENQIEQERARLAILLGLSVNVPLRVVDPDPIGDAPVPESEGELIQRAESARPDLQQARENREAARMSELSARSSRYPYLSMQGTYTRTQDATRSPVWNLNRDATWRAGVALGIPIFDGLQTKGRIQQATADRRAQDQALALKRLQVSLDVRVAYLAIKNASEEIRSAREGVSLAEESVRLQKALYESGGGTLLEWNNAQVELTRARVAQVQGEISLRLAQAGLENALGEDAR